MFLDLLYYAILLKIFFPRHFHVYSIVFKNYGYGKDVNAVNESKLFKLNVYFIFLYIAQPFSIIKH